MSVTVDSEPLAFDKLGLQTVGQVLSHVQREDRLVVHILLDGLEPDLDRISALRQSRIDGHTLFIETTHPREMAMEVLGDVESQLDDADRLKNEAVDLLGRNQAGKAMEKLSGCFRVWQHAQESVQKTAQLLRIDLMKVLLDGPQGQPLENMLRQFTEKLGQIRTALENRDFVSLCDVLTYEMAETGQQWKAALAAIRSSIA